MKFDIVIFLFTFVALESAKGFRDTKLINTMNGLLDGLALETWNVEESACLIATEAILNGVKNNTLWAITVWDAMQLPAGTLYGTLYHLGNFDQCLKVPWPEHQSLKTQYCLVNVELATSSKYGNELVDPYHNADGYIDAAFRRRNRAKTLFLGVCLPASCSPGSVAKISRHIFSFSHLPFEDIAVDPHDCQVAGSVQKPLGFYVFWFIILTMVSVCVSVYLFGNTQRNSNSTVAKVIRCFCLTRNFDALTQVHKEEARVLYSMRLLTCGTLIVAHFFYLSLTTFINQVDFENEVINNPIWKPTLHIELFVDTFILMSGLLHFRSLMSSKTAQPYKTLFKRYLRLLFPLYALSIVLMSYVLPYIGSGPVWPRMVRKRSEPCAKTWWKNLLMITNTVDDVSFCSEISWYIHCDFQLTILGTVIFIIYRKNRQKGIMFGLLAYVFSVILLASWNYWQELPGLLWYDFGESLCSDTNKVYASVYRPFYTRASSYLIGVTMGYIMTLYKPQHYRNRLSKGISILGFIMAMSLLLSCLQVGVKMHKKELSVLQTSLIAAFDKTIWCIGICIIIIICEYGQMPIVNDFLGSKVFVPLSKLTYSCYLFHIIFVYREVFSLRASTKFDMIGMITSGLGYVVISMSTSYLIWLFVEAPVTNLINILFDSNRNPSIERNGCKETIYSNGSTKTNKIS